MKTDYILDTVGKFCPVPIIETSARLKALNIGETLTIISDDAGIKTDMPHWCKMTGNDFLGEDERDGEYIVYVRKTAE